MNKKHRIELLKTIAATVNHDDGKYFDVNDSARLDNIAALLDDKGYMRVEAGLFHMYIKKPIEDMEKPVIVLSSHVDTHRNIRNPFSEVEGKKLHGTYDNGITNAAILTLMLEDRLPDNVVVMFTGNEEYGMKGASEAAEFLRRLGAQAKVIVTDVTDRSWKGKNVVSLENCGNSGKWTERLKEALDKSDFKWKLKGVYYDDETAVYTENGFECLSFCIPTQGEMHTDEGLITRKKTYFKYIEALALAVTV